MTCYEAAEIDGAGQFRIAWSIKIPAIRPAILLTVIFSSSGRSSSSTSRAAVQHRAELPSARLHAEPLRLQPGFRNQEINYAAAIAFLLGIVIMIVSFVVQIARPTPDGAPS